MTRISQTCLTIMFLTIMFTAQAWAATLENGVPIKTSVNGMTFANVGIVVPDGATGMTVSITGGSDDLDLYLKYGSPLSGSSVAEFDADADFISDGPGADETISITPASIPALRAGTWYIGTLNLNATKVSFTIIATIDTGVDHTVPFSLNVDKTTVNFDWTAMVAANTYTLAVALADEVGDIDMSTLNLLDMGSSKTFSTSGLTSGMIFYATILADTAQGLEVSNTCQFMPIAGTVTFPGTGGVLMQVDDPGGIGNITVSGSVNGDTANITQIAGDDGSGPFVLTVANDKPVTYVKGGITTNFISLADGSVVVQSERIRTASSAQDVLDCRERIKGLMASSDIWFAREDRRLTGMVEVLGSLWLSSGGNVTPTPTGLKLGFLIEILKGAKKSNMERYNTEITSLEQKYEECGSDPDPDPTPDPDPDPDPDNPVITIDTSCPIPAGAVYKEFDTGTALSQYYLLDKHDVGPYKYWSTNASGSLYLSFERCRNAEGEKNGWHITYYENSNMKQANHYKNGVEDGHRYDFYEDGSLYIDNTFVNGVNTYRLVYFEDGSLKMYCDCDGDGVWHWQ